MSKTIDYYLTLASPWTYLAGPRIKALAEKHQATINVKPFDIRRIFAMTGVKPVPDRPPQIQANRLNELRRWSAFVDMPITMKPKFFPVDPTPTGCLLIAAVKNGANGLDLANAYLTALWSEDRNLADEATLVDVANAQGLDGKALLAASQGDEVKAIFEKNTEEAIAANVFGSPTWVFDGELYWGQDRLDFVARHLERMG